MASAKLLLQNLKTRLLFKRIANSNYDPVRFRPRIQHGVPLPESTRLGLTHGHLEAWGTDQPVCSLLYIPGGGFCFGPNADHREFLAHIGSHLAARMFLLSHRLAPEHPFPAALEDTIEALETVAGGNQPLVVLADSAGAALALSAMMKLRDAGTPIPVACAVYLSAYTDLAHTGLSMVNHSAKDPMFGAEALIHKAYHYLQGHNPTDSSASPYWGDPAGLSPSLFLVGSTEVMYDDSARMVERGGEAGCDFTLSVYDRAPHDFPLIANLPEARRARKEIANFVCQHLRKTQA